MKEVPGRLRRLVRRIGRRGAVLLIMGVVDLGIGASLLLVPPELVGTPAYITLAAFLPLTVWGVLWGFSGLLSLTQAFMKTDITAYTVSSTVKALTALQYLFAWMFAGAERGWVSAILWTLLSLLMLVLAGQSEVTRIVLSPMSDDAVVTADSSGRVTSWNARAEEMFGWGQDEITGRKLTELMPMRYRCQHEAAIARIKATGKSSLSGTMLSVEALHRDGREFPVELVVSVSDSGGGLKLGAVIRSRKG